MVLDTGFVHRMNEDHADEHSAVGLNPRDLVITIIYSYIHVQHSTSMKLSIL